MSAWTEALQELGLEIFGRESAGEMWALVVICMLVSFLLYKWLSSGFVGRGEKAFLTLVPGLLIMVVAATTVRAIFDANLLAQLIVVLVCFLGIVLPLTARIEKTGYFNALLPWGVTALVIAAILYVEPKMMQSFQRGVEKGSLLKGHRDEINALGK